MADLNSTIVRGNLRVTEDINTTGRITGGNITGHLALNENTFNVNFRPNNKAYATGFYYGTTGNEALTLTTKNTVTAIQFMNGQDPETLVGDSWRGLIPALQIKYNKVAINKALSEGQSPSYELDVNGSIGATTIHENGTSLTEKYAAKTHTHNDYITSAYLGQNYYSKTQIDDGFSPSGHNHNTSYYTKTEVDNKLSGKANSDHNHDTKYAAKTHTHSPSSITGAPGDTAEGTPFVLGSTGSGAEGAWLDLNNYYSLKTHTHTSAPALDIRTTAPTSANTSGTLKVVVLSSEPSTKYNGWLYIITG